MDRVKEEAAEEREREMQVLRGQVEELKAENEVRAAEHSRAIKDLAGVAGRDRTGRVSVREQQASGLLEASLVKCQAQVGMLKG